MDKYRRLVSNTVVFAIGTFSSKVLVFLLMPLYVGAFARSIRRDRSDRADWQPASAAGHIGDCQRSHPIRP